MWSRWNRKAVSGRSHLLYSSKTMSSLFPTWRRGRSMSFEWEQSMKRDQELPVLQPDQLCHKSLTVCSDSFLHFIKCVWTDCYLHCLLSWLSLVLLSEKPLTLKLLDYSLFQKSFSLTVVDYIVSNWSVNLLTNPFCSSTRTLHASKFWTSFVCGLLFCHTLQFHSYRRDMIILKMFNLFLLRFNWIHPEILHAHQFALAMIIIYLYPDRCYIDPVEVLWFSFADVSLYIYEVLGPSWLHW